MTTTYGLNVDDIQAIIAIHFGVNPDAVKVFTDTVYPYKKGEESYETIEAKVVIKAEIAIPPSLICKNRMSSDI